MKPHIHHFMCHHEDPDKDMLGYLNHVSIAAGLLDTGEKLLSANYTYHKAFKSVGNFTKQQVEETEDGRTVVRTELVRDCQTVNMTDEYRLQVVLELNVNSDEQKRQLG